MFFQQIAFKPCREFSKAAMQAAAGVAAPGEQGHLPSEEPARQKGGRAGRSRREDAGGERGQEGEGRGRGAGGTGRRKRGRVGRRRGGGGEGEEGRGREDAAEWPGLRRPLCVGRSSGRTLKALASFWTPGTRSAWPQNLSEPFAYESCVRGRAAPGTPKEDKDRFKPTEQTHVPEVINHRHCLSIAWCLPCAVLGARRHPEAGTAPHPPPPRPQGPANSSRV